MVEKKRVGMLRPYFFHILSYLLDVNLSTVAILSIGRL